jgi:tRNA acetyltransferase TAN1
MVSDPNLLATTERMNESEACSELWMLLRSVGDEKPIVDRSSIPGLIIAKTMLNPVEAVSKLRSELHMNPEVFRVLLRVIPLEVTVDTGLQAIKDTARKLASKISVGESFRITVEKRRTRLRSREIIETVADVINHRVDLEDPDWVILIEVIRRMTGVSVIPPEGVLNVQKEMARLLAEGKQSAPLDEDLC